GDGRAARPTEAAARADLGPRADRPREGPAVLERRCPAHDRVDRALEGAQASWLSLRRPDHGLRAHAGVRPGERSPRRLPRARRRRTRPKGRALTPARLRALRSAAQLLAGEPAECFCSAAKQRFTVAARLPPSYRSERLRDHARDAPNGRSGRAKIGLRWGAPLDRKRK